MYIHFIVIVMVLMVILSAILFDNYPNISRVLIAILMILVIYTSMALTRLEQKEKLITAVPVQFQDKIAFSIYKNTLINCSKDFDMQFKEGDSIYVFEDLDTWCMGLKWDGGTTNFRTERVQN